MILWDTCRMIRITFVQRGGEEMLWKWFSLITMLDLNQKEASISNKNI